MAQHQLHTHAISSFDVPRDEHSHARTVLDSSSRVACSSKLWENCSNNNGNRSIMQPHFKHKLNKEPLWMDRQTRRDMPSWVVVKEDEHVELGTADSFPPSLIWECSKNKDLARGSRLHTKLREKGLAERKYADALVTMYAKCGELSKAQALLDTHNSTSIIPWTALISAYARQGQGQNALDCFQRMQGEGISPDAMTYSCILKACAVIGAIDKGKQIHDEISRQKLLKHDIVLAGALVDMYAKCGALSKAQNVLENLPSRNVISWSALIAGYAQNGQGNRALECLEQMQHEGIPPDAVTYVSILKACGVMGAIDKGRQIHDEILRQGLLQHSIALGGALVDMYAKCGALPEAQSVLEMLLSCDVVSWNALIAGYAQMGQGQEALDCLKRMQLEGIFPDAVTYASTLKACAMIEALDKGKQIHDEISRRGLLDDDVVLGNALVDMYAKCSALPQAQSVLEKLPFRNIMSWSVLISGYVQKGQAQQALECYEKAQQEGISPDALTYACVLKACGGVRDFDKGKQIHEEISRQGLLENDIVLGGALVDMYSKCGALSEAHSVLDKLPSRNVVLWNALIAGYGQEGQGEQALKCFEQMQRESIRPDVVTYHCLLNLCCHLGMLAKGQELFDNMGVIYGLKADVECFTCMVDLLGRAGHLVKAAEVIEEMPFAANSAIWHSLLGACQKWVDTIVGTWAFEQAVKLDIRDEAAYISILNVYSAAGMTEKVKEIEAKRIKAFNHVSL